MTSYGPDLAAVHHSGFGWAAEGAATTLLGELRRRNLPGGLVVDLGSGSGILAGRLTDAGYDVLGVDLSADMISLARREAPQARFVRGSAFDFEPPSCTAVTAIGEVLNYRFDKRSSLRSLGGVFRRVRRALEPGGVFLFDLSGPGRGEPTGARERWHDEEGYTLFFRAEEDPRRQLLTRKIVVFIPDGKRYRRVDELHTLRLFEPGKVTDLLRASGFTVRRLRGYPGGPDLAGWHVFLARAK